MIQAVVVVGLASLYISYTVRYLEGPFGLYYKVLSWVGVLQPIYGSDSEIVNYIEVTSDRFIAKLVRCFWCFATWVSLVVTIIYGLLMDMDVGQLFLVWLASAGLSGWLFERIPDGKSE